MLQYPIQNRLFRSNDDVLPLSAAGDAMRLKGRWKMTKTGVRNSVLIVSVLLAITGAPGLAATPKVASGPSVTNPVADPKAEVVLGKARFTVLTPEMIRMEWSADGKFEDHASFVFINRRLPVPQYEKSVQGGKLTIKTSALKLTYTPAADGKFAPANLAIELTAGGEPVVWHPGQADPDNLKGTTRSLDKARGSQILEPIEPGLVSRSGWAMVDDSTRPLFDSADFRFLQGEKSPWPWAMERPAGDRQDWYFLGYGHNYRKALGDYVQVAGRIPLPPRYAFGIWWSRYWDYTDQELDELVKGFRDNAIPLDVLVVDTGWHINGTQLLAQGEKDQSGEKLGWTGYTWNKVLFPDPDKFLAKIHDDGIKFVLNLHPASGVHPWEDAYPAMAKAMGIDPASHKYVPLNLTDQTFATNYMNLLHHPLEKQGVDFWWLDWWWVDWLQTPQPALPNVKPTWWLNYVHFTDQEREGKRPLIVHRWGGLGNHRYQIGFTGDTISVWDSLAFQPWFTATAANVGYAYWSHDIGGHIPGAVEPELYTRWVQFGAFSPILRTHTTQNADAERRAWAYPEPYSSILRQTFQLRHALEPYLYTEARRTYDTGVAFLRPLYYDWPEEQAAYDSKNEYMFGDQMLVAPITAPGDKATGLAKEAIWLPAGEWIEWASGRHFVGPARVERQFSIDQIPVFVKAGAIVPMQPMQRATEKGGSPLIVNVWPLNAGTTSTYSLYEDSGEAESYQRGAFARTPMKATQTADTLRLEINPVQGSYRGMAKTRSYELRLPDDWPPTAVIVNGVALTQAAGGTGWSYDGNSLTTVIRMPATSVSAKVVVEIRRTAGLVARRGELDGFIGAMTRLRSAYDAIQQTRNPVTTAVFSPPPEPLVFAMQTGDRLRYHPETAQREMDQFAQVLARANQAVVTVRAGFDAKFDQVTRKQAADKTPPDESQRQQYRRVHDLVVRAEAQTKEAVRTPR